MSSGLLRSALAFVISGLIVWAASISEATGSISSDSAPAGKPSFSQIISAARGRITGILFLVLCISSISSLALVVTTEKVSRVTPPWRVQESHIPAREKISSSRSVIYQGIFRPPRCCHSKKPLTGTRQRREAKDPLKEGFVAMVSERALKVFIIISLASFSSATHEGISPQRMSLRPGEPGDPEEPEEPEEPGETEDPEEPEEPGETGEPNETPEPAEPAEHTTGK